MIPRLVVALCAGALFGFGLSLSGMVDPARVLGFLNLAGDWDPSLAFVLAGAVAVAGVGVAVQRRLARPLLADAFDLPEGARIDARLVGGSAIFGIGWGIAGFCPGPALSLVGTGIPPVLLFVAAMIAGMLAHDRFVAPRGPGRAKFAYTHRAQPVPDAGG